jgi:hypothetical protein
VDEERSGGFLPPRPAGPEPELGKGAGGAPAQKPTQPLASPGPQAPAAGPQAPASQPPPAYPSAPGQGGQPPPSGWQQPPPGWQQPPWGYQQREPDNGPAIAGFVLSLVAGALLVFSAGLSTVVSIGCAIAGIVYGRKGKRKVDAGETSKNRGLAQAGFIVGIVSLVLSLIATAFWILILVLALTDDEFQQDLENEFEDPNNIRASVRLALVAARGAAHLLA